jgi:hypothetical protein
MSFSSAEWTISELCVWILTRSKDAINDLSPEARRSLKLANLVHPGSAAKCDDIIAAAQEGTLHITYLRFKSPTQPAARLQFAADFWRNAEIVDYRGWMAGPGFGSCIARRIGDVDAPRFSQLLVNSAEAKELWQALRKSTAPVKGEIPDGQHIERMLSVRDQYKSWEEVIAHEIDLSRVVGHSLEAKRKRLVKKASLEESRRSSRN